MIDLSKFSLSLLYSDTGSIAEANHIIYGTAGYPIFGNLYNTSEDFDIYFYARTATFDYYETTPGSGTWPPESDDSTACISTLMSDATTNVWSETPVYASHITPRWALYSALTTVGGNLVRRYYLNVEYGHAYLSFPEPPSGPNQWTPALVHLNNIIIKPQEKYFGDWPGAGVATPSNPAIKFDVRSSKAFRSTTTIDGSPESLPLVGSYTGDGIQHSAILVPNVYAYIDTAIPAIGSYDPWYMHFYLIPTLTAAEMPVITYNSQNAIAEAEILTGYLQWAHQ